MSQAICLTLPVEILERIFLELHYFDICTVKLVSTDVDLRLFPIGRLF
jgi:hypothetical protein